MIPKRGPAIDIFETTSEGYVLIEIPGLQSIKDIHLNGSRLTLKGHLPYPYPVPKENLIQSERFLGEFSRTIDLLFYISHENSTAKYKNGLLIIKIVKDPSARLFFPCQDHLG